MLKKLAAVLLYSALALIVYRLYANPTTDALLVTVSAMIVVAFLVLETDRVLARPREERRRAAVDSVLGFGLMIFLIGAILVIPFPWGVVFALGVAGLVWMRELFVKRAASRETGGPDAPEST